MEQVIFSSKSESFKKPFGAVKNGETVSFSLHILSCLNPTSVRLAVREDESSETLYISMQEMEKYDNYLIFSCSTAFNSPKLYFYRFEFSTKDGIKYVGLKDGVAKIGEWLCEWQLTVYDRAFTSHFCAKGDIMYQIFPDRFFKSDGFSPLPAKNERKIHTDWEDTPEFIYDAPAYKANDFFCGNLKGIEEKLDYIKSLGVSIIYLNPVFESAENHRYSTADYLKIDPYLGTNEDFKSLCESCKKQNIRVVLDGVFSHTGADSIYFNKYGHFKSLGAYNSTTSKYFNWYSFTDFPEKYSSWWGFETLPNVNETNPDFLNFITGENGVLSYWHSLGCGGWRLDVADELPDGFLDSLYKRVKAEDKNALIIGEVWEDATNKLAYGKRRRYLLGGQMDSVMNYPWRTAILEFVENGDENLFNERIFSVLENYPPHAVLSLMNVLSTHDTVRALTYFGVKHKVLGEAQGAYEMTKEEYALGKQKLMLAAFLQFTLPGIPSIYYGDEVGLYGFSDPYSRKTYPHGKEDLTLLEFYRSLAKMRTTYREDFTKPLKLFKTTKGFYSFFRGSLLCAINLNEHENNLTENKNIVFSHGKIKTDNEKITLFPNSAVILK